VAVGFEAKWDYFGDPNMKIIQTFLLSCIVFPSFIAAQGYPQDWDNYVISVKEFPVSIVVNLGLKEKAPVAERPYLVILRTKYSDRDDKGFPGEGSRPELEGMENELEAALTKSNGAIYAGRFTQRGIREFYFYTLDTLDYMRPCNEVMKKYHDFPWLAKALYDKQWANYFEVLFPPDTELEKIENRRMVKYLEGKGDNITRPRKIEHLMFFKTQGNRKKFLETFTMEGFSVTEMPVEKTETEEFPFRLVMTREDKPEVMNMDAITLQMLQLCKKNNGRYQGWQTYVVK
jgi:uncharacterized protein (TIGR01619 family)